MIGIAYAQDAAAAAAPGGFVQFLPLILFVAVVWFLMIRPQMRRAKEHKLLVSALQKGDEVVTQGGIAGRITKVGDAYVSLEVMSGAETLVQREAVTLVLPKGTLKGVL